MKYIGFIRKTCCGIGRAGHVISILRLREVEACSRKGWKAVLGPDGLLPWLFSNPLCCHYKREFQTTCLQISLHVLQSTPKVSTFTYSFLVYSGFFPILSNFFVKFSLFLWFAFKMQISLRLGDLWEPDNKWNQSRLWSLMHSVRIPAWSCMGSLVSFNMSGNEIPYLHNRSITYVAQLL